MRISSENEEVTVTSIVALLPDGCCTSRVTSPGQIISSLLAFLMVGMLFFVHRMPAALMTFRAAIDLVAPVSGVDAYSKHLLFLADQYRRGMVGVGLQIFLLTSMFRTMRA